MNTCDREMWAGQRSGEVLLVDLGTPQTDNDCRSLCDADRITVGDLRI